MKTSLFLGTALSALLVSGFASAATHNYVASEMTGDKEKPTAVNTANSGEARFTYDDVAGTLCGHITLTPSTFQATAAHIHAGDDNSTGDPYIIFEDSQVKGDVGNTTSGTKRVLSINMKITADQGSKLTGENYVNVHSTAHPDGEIRDQLIADGDTAAGPETCDEVGGADGGTDGGGTVSSSSSSGSSGTTSSSGTTTTSPDGGAAATTDDTSSGCNTSGSSQAPTYAAVLGLGLVVAAASRKRKKS
jgi:hypothetical protein